MLVARYHYSNISGNINVEYIFILMYMTNEEVYFLISPSSLFHLYSLTTDLHEERIAWLSHMLLPRTYTCSYMNMTLWSTMFMGHCPWRQVINSKIEMCNNTHLHCNMALLQPSNRKGEIFYKGDVINSVHKSMVYKVVGWSNAMFYYNVCCSLTLLHVGLLT